MLKHIWRASRSLFLTGICMMALGPVNTLAAEQIAVNAAVSAHAPTVTVQLTQPSPGRESHFANQRDFYVAGTLSGRHFAQALNVQFLVKDAQGRIVRQVQSQVDPFLKCTSPASLNLKYYASARGDWSHPWSPSRPEDLRLNPSPEMVQDQTQSGLENDAAGKAVVNGAKEFAALILGGATKHLQDIHYSYPQDLQNGSYELIIKVLDLNGRTVAVSPPYSLTFGNQSSGNTNKMIIARFSPTAKDGVPHKEKVTELARRQGLKIMFDLFPGYWSRPLQPWLGTGSIFAEYYPRWLINDVIEYRDAPETRAVLYNISSSCATQQELAYVNYWQYLNRNPQADENKLAASRDQARKATARQEKNGGQVFFYRYDIGDPLVTYAKNGQGNYTRQGKLVPFDGRKRSHDYKQLIFARAEIEEPTATLFNPAGQRVLSLKAQNTKAPAAPTAKAGAGTASGPASSQAVTGGASAKTALPAASLRALITGPGPRVFTNEENLEVLHGIRALPYNVDFNVYNDVHLKAGQRLSLLGVVTPLPAPVKFNAATGAGEPQNMIKYIRYNLTSPDGTLSTLVREVGLTRQYTPTWQAPSMYEFLHKLPAETFRVPGRYLVQAEALDSRHQTVPRTQTIFKVIAEK